jgi:hypothetical protein
MKKMPWRWFDYRTDLPQWLTSRVGQIAVEWSVVERELEQLIHLLTDTEIAIARIATIRMPARTRTDAIAYLLEWYIYESKLDPSFLRRFNKLGKRLTTETQNQRNMVAHGLWSKFGHNWHVLRLAAKRAAPDLRPNLEKLSRPVLPQIESITRAKLDEIVRQIVADAKALQALCEDLHVALSPSRYKPPAYTRRRPKPPKKKVQ